ncbi:hypothetical protein SZ55_1553 [Pseudomonas sp. FeS53a]|nr:hypothetical protein SZ55_1553 [Pseudomonas sp. FeS53a]
MGFCPGKIPSGNWRQPCSNSEQKSVTQVSPDPSVRTILNSCEYQSDIT